MQNEYLKNLHAAYRHAWTEAEALLETAGKEKRELTAEEQAKWDAANADMEAKNEQIRTLQDAELREHEAAEARTAYESIFSAEKIEEREVKQVDQMTRFLKGEIRTMDLDFRGVMREKQMLRRGARAEDIRDELRTFNEDTSASGGYSVPTSFMRQLWDFIEFYSGARQLNCTMLPTSSGEPLQIPNVLSHGTATLKGEGTALTAVDAQLGQVTLHAWKYGVLSQVSVELLADSGIDVLGFVAEDTARAIARITDTDYVTGSGSSKPKGIMTTQAVGATSQTVATGVPSYGNIVDLIYSVNPVARSQGAQFFTRDTNLAKIRKITDSQNRPLWEPSLQVGEPETLMGYGIVQDPNVTAFATAAGTHMGFGNARTFMIRDVSGLRFERSDEFAFSSDLVTFKTVLRTDSNWVGGNNGEFKFLLAPTT